MSLPDLATLPDAELRALESKHTLSNEEWQRVVAELARRSTPVKPPPPPPIYDSHVATAPAVAPPVAIRARVVAIDLPFWDIVALMVKWSIASIPAMIILAVLGFLIVGFAAAIGASLPHR